MKKDNLGETCKQCGKGYFYKEYLACDWYEVRLSCSNEKCGKRIDRYTEKE